MFHMAQRGRPRKNPLIAATQITGSEITIEKTKELKGYNAEAYLGLAAKIAKSTVYYGNKKFKNADKYFPVNPLLRTVQKFFPYAEGGALYVDEPTDPQEERECGLKAAAIKKEGLRYIVITRDMHDMEETEALAELRGAA